MRNIVTRIEGFSGADISALYTETAMCAIRRQLSMDENGKATMTKSVDELMITAEDFESAITIIKSTQQRTQNKDESE